MPTLVISEKPSSALKIAQALGEGGMEKKSSRGVAYYRLRRGGEDILVAPAVGHLFVLAEEKPSGWSYPVFRTAWKPVHLGRSSAWAKKYYQNLEALSKKADSFISACDYDIEGSVIAYNILRFICKVRDGKRMKFSTLTAPELREAYAKASPHLDFEQIEAGLARHTLDFLWGINTSRALTLALKDGGGFKVLSTGRVQGPALDILLQREKEIRAFLPTPYWELELTAGIRGATVLAVHEKGKFLKREEPDKILEKCTGKDGTVASVEKNQRKIPPPAPFDLTTLQREAFLHFGMSPTQSLDVAQSLYEQGAISYPRTSSQKLPPQIGYQSILEALRRLKDYAGPASALLAKPGLKPNEGKKTDSAHPAIYPTAETPDLKKLSSWEKKLYDIIVKRFLATFSEPATRETARLTVAIEGELFIAEGARTLQANWMDVYSPYAKFSEQPLPPAQAGDQAKNQGLALLDKETQPPKRFTPATVLKKLEDLGLGTKATRANILQTLYDRGYIEGTSIQVTKLGEAVATALEAHCPEIISVELTRRFEQDMEAIQEGKKNREDIIREAEQSLGALLSGLKKNQKKVGDALYAGLKEALQAASTIGPCTCGQNLVKRRSRTGQPFVGCTGYPACTQTFSLPHSGAAKVLPRKCETCGLSLILVTRKGRRPWMLCVRDGFKKSSARAPVATVQPPAPAVAAASPKPAKAPRPGAAASRRKKQPPAPEEEKK